MGLMYILPAKHEESDRVQIAPGKSGKNAITIKSYGLPYTFWFYWLASVVTIATMAFAIYQPAIKLIDSHDWLNIIMGYSVLMLLFILPFAGLVFLAYEYRLIKSSDQLVVNHCVFGLCVYKKSIDLELGEPFSVKHHLDSPNMAKIQNKDGMRAFHNHGHWHLYAHTYDNKYISIDRSSNKSSLVKLASLLSEY